MTDIPLAYFITIRTYGTWLSGDPRGSVDREHRTFDTPFKERDDFRANSQRRSMKAPQMLITPAMRRAIEAEIQRTCEYRSWELFAINVRTNHVHIVVAAPETPEAVMRELKVYATKALRKQGLVSAQAPVWASHGSTLRAWNERQLETFINYTLEFQGDDLPGSGWRAARDRPGQEDEPARP